MEKLTFYVNPGEPVSFWIEDLEEVDELIDQLTFELSAADSEDRVGIRREVKSLRTIR